MAMGRGWKLRTASAVSAILFAISVLLDGCLASIAPPQGEYGL